MNSLPKPQQFTSVQSKIIEILKNRCYFKQAQINVSKSKEVYHLKIVLEFRSQATTSRRDAILGFGEAVCLDS